MGLSRTVEPITTPITLAELKAFSRIENTSEDTFITGLIGQATSTAETGWDRAFCVQTMRYTQSHIEHVIKIPRPPLISVTSVKYYDLDGVLHTLVSGTDYDVSTYGQFGCVRFETIPNTERFNNDAVDIVYQCGYGVVPAQVKLAITVLTAYWYDNRTAIGTIPDAVKELLDQIYPGTRFPDSNNHRYYPHYQIGVYQ